jgi:hypothetical protein
MDTEMVLGGFLHSLIPLLCLPQGDVQASQARSPP